MTQASYTDLRDMSGSQCLLRQVPRDDERDHSHTGDGAQPGIKWLPGAGFEIGAPGRHQVIPGNGGARSGFVPVNVPGPWLKSNH